MHGGMYKSRYSGFAIVPQYAVSDGVVKGIVVRTGNRWLKQHERYEATVDVTGMEYLPPKETVRRRQANQKRGRTSDMSQYRMRQSNALKQRRDICPDCGTVGQIQGVKCPNCDRMYSFSEWLTTLEKTNNNQ